MQLLTEDLSRSIYRFRRVTRLSIWAKSLDLQDEKFAHRKTLSDGLSLTSSMEQLVNNSSSKCTCLCCPQTNSFYAQTFHLADQRTLLELKGASPDEICKSIWTNLQWEVASNELVPVDAVRTVLCLSSLWRKVWEWKCSSTSFHLISTIHFLLQCVERRFGENIGAWLDRMANKKKLARSPMSSVSKLQNENF